MVPFKGGRSVVRLVLDEFKELINIVPVASQQGLKGLTDGYGLHSGRPPIVRGVLANRLVDLLGKRLILPKIVVQSPQGRGRSLVPRGR